MEAHQYDLFETEAYREFLGRVHLIQPTSRPLWGKMTPAGLFAHLSAYFEMAMGLQPRHRSPGGFLFGWMVRGYLVGNKPYPRNLPTDPAFRIEKDRGFRKEKDHFLFILERFHNKEIAENLNIPNPFFRFMRPPDWNQAMAKHLDHHLRQFGV